MRVVGRYGGRTPNPYTTFADAGTACGTASNNDPAEVMEAATEAATALNTQPNGNWGQSGEYYSVQIIMGSYLF